MHICGKKLVSVNNTKFLGVIINSKLNWSYHIRYINNKIHWNLNKNKKIPNYLNDFFLEIFIFHLFIHTSYTTLQYGATHMLRT